MLVLDNITRDLEECSDTDTEVEEAITPDVSADDMGELFSFRELSMDMEKAPSEDMEAAMALLKFKARRALSDLVSTQEAISNHILQYGT
ncbi:hypothetical protein A0H81_01228 [Grifola frondosa]|uniref:Uncharacterized protein n=1 Tax=Grifola frondosa TaxID=5627 RepID=A0A1C7MRT8_GRIFR|nr:hypothetical protein A0H81_01228 [Grifola frondosa]